MNRVRNNLIQFIIACVLIVSSVLLIATAAQSLYTQRSKTLHIPKSLFEGRHTFSLLHANTCFGSITTSLEPIDDFISYSFQGEAQVSVQETVSTIAVNGFLQINSLDQVFAAMLNVSAGELRWQLGTSGAVPMTWSIKSLSDPDATQQTGTLPGPLAIQRMDNLSYQVTHPLLEGIRPQRTSSFTTAFASSFPVSIREQDCVHESGVLPLDPLLAQILPVANKFNFFR